MPNEKLLTCTVHNCRSAGFFLYVTGSILITNSGRHTVVSDQIKHCSHSNYERQVMRCECIKIEKGPWITIGQIG